MTAHAPYALFGDTVLAYGKTTKAACGKRVTTSKLVSRDDTDCNGCQQAIAADRQTWSDMRDAAEALKAAGRLEIIHVK